MKPSIAAVVLTLNEEMNLPICLDSLKGWCKQIFVVDSGSTDRTVAIAREAGAQVVVHAFETHAKQWNWALQTVPIACEWVLALDADQRVTPKLKDEMLHALSDAPDEVAGFYLPRKQFFRGRWIRWGGYWPKYLLKLFRRGAAHSDEKELVDFRFYVRGEIPLLTQALIEHNEKEREILFWLEKHLRFVELHAQEEYGRRHKRVGWSVRPAPRGTPDQKVLWRKEIWYRLPPVVRPFFFFLYRYIFQLGMLDGAQGALYHFLHGFWYELMIAIRLKELERNGKRLT